MTEAAPNHYCIDVGDEDEDLRSTASNTTVGSATPVNRGHYVTSQPLMTIVRGGADGPSLPEIRLVRVPGVVHSDVHAPADSGSEVLSAGDAVREERVWHQICSGHTLMPHARVDYAQSRRCRFCTDEIAAGVPVMELTHLCTFDAREQRVQVGLSSACDKCARQRSDVVGASDPLLVASNVWLLGQLTRHLQYVMAIDGVAMQDYRIEVDDSARACDGCFKPLRTDSEFMVVACKSRETHEYALFVVCSELCKDQLRRSLECMLGDSILRPRPRYPDDVLEEQLFTLPTRRAKSPLAVQEDLPVARWRLLSDAEVGTIVHGKDYLQLRSGSVVIHRCASTACFCQFTHRGSVRKRAAGIETHGADRVLDPHYLLQKVFAAFVRNNIYADVLATDEMSRCIACRRPCTTVCTECRAVRMCSQMCVTNAAALKRHQRVCRPYCETWTAFTYV